MLNQNHLKNYIDDLVVAFEEDQDIDMDVVLVQLQKFRDQVDALASEYSQRLNEEAEPYRQNLLEIFKHFSDALEHLEDFMDEMEIESLRQASQEAKLGDTKMKDFKDLAERQSSQRHTLG